MAISSGNTPTSTLRRASVEIHEKLFHLFVVSHDLRHFEHLHPTLATDGSLAIDVTLPRAGAYQLYADFLPDRGTPQLLQRTLLTAGFTHDRKKGARD